MGFTLTVDGRNYEATNFNVRESSTPLAAGDSSGSVGTIQFDIPRPDPELVPDHPLNLFGVNYLSGKSVRLSDTRKGFTLGTITSVGYNQGGGSISVTANSRLGELNVFNVQAPPVIGTLYSAVQQYLALANVTTDFLVDPTIATQPVIFPGWGGELWYNLKRMAAAVKCDVSLVSGVILFRPLRARVAARGRDIDRQVSVGGGSLAQFVEVYQYNNRQITNELVYPPGGWSEDVTIINVNAGETVEEVLQLEASVSSITQPVMQTFVSRGHDTSSVYTVVGDDGLPIQPALWADRGGRLSVSINEDTTSLTVTITAPTGIPNKAGEEIGVFGISLSSDSTTGRYSTLRIVGSGVAFSKEAKRVPTGITAQETATEVGVTIDNPFLSTYDEVASAGIWAARTYSGTAMTLSGSVTAINQLGNTGEVTLRDYNYFQGLHTGRTYAQVQTFYAGKTYAQIETEVNAGLDSDFENQVFGNVSGARVWDKTTARWYRIREGSLLPDRINFDSADDDLLHSDLQTFHSGKTYSSIQLRYNGLQYRDVDLMGLR